MASCTASLRKSIGSCQALWACDRTGAAWTSCEGRRLRRSKREIPLKPVSNIA